MNFACRKIAFLCTISSILVILMGCSGSQNATATGTLISFTPTSTVSPTVSPTASAVPVEPFITSCIDLEDPVSSFPPVETANHYLLMLEPEPPYEPSLMNLANGIEFDLPRSAGENIRDVYVSPDQRYIVYDTSSYLTIADPKGNIIDRLTWETDWTFFWGWLGNDQLMVTQYAEKDDHVPFLIVLNLLDGTRQELISDYPDFDKGYWLNWQFNRVVYDTTLTLALYPSSLSSYSISLFDIPNQTTLATSPIGFAGTEQPEWSPDGSMVVFASLVADYQAELFLLDRSGNDIQLTHFADRYIEVIIGEFSWSPDGKHIAFWFSSGDDPFWHLAVVNVETKLVTNYCIQDTRNVSRSVKPIWSPDSHMVLVEVREGEDAPIKDIWVDIVREIGDVMPTDKVVGGWLYFP